MSAFPKSFLRFTTIHIRAPNGANGSRMRTKSTLKKVILDPTGSTVTINMADTLE
jgi:hypothetical protein